MLSLGEGGLAAAKPQEKERAGMWTGIRVAMVLLAASHSMAVSTEKQPLLPAVEAEEGIYTYVPANNGAGPQWCYGSTCLLRIGKDVFAAGLETLKNRKPLNNCRWLFFKRADQGWRLVQADPNGRTREPCPLVGFPDGRLFLSANPTLTAPDAYSGSAQPQVLGFSARDPTAPFIAMLPPWEGKPAFTEHSYRSFAADGPNRELILFNVLGYDMYHSHLLWLDQSLWDLRLREKFFPGVPLTHSLEHAVVDKGRVAQRTTLAAGGEGLSKEIPGYARLHATPDGRLFVFYYCGGADAQGRPLAENRLMEICPDGTLGEPVRVPLKHPFTNFMTATERDGSRRSRRPS
jgi:hypothetical protein